MGSSGSERVGRHTADRNLLIPSRIVICGVLFMRDDFFPAIIEKGSVSSTTSAFTHAPFEISLYSIVASSVHQRPESARETRRFNPVERQ